MLLSIKSFCEELTHVDVLEGLANIPSDPRETTIVEKSNETVQLSNRYFSTELRLCSDFSDTDQLRGLLVWWDGESADSFRATVQAWYEACDVYHNLDLFSAILCRTNLDSFPTAVKSDIYAWTVSHGFEIIELARPDYLDQENDPEWLDYGWERVAKAMHSHIWAPVATNEVNGGKHGNDDECDPFSEENLAKLPTVTGISDDSPAWRNVETAVGASKEETRIAEHDRTSSLGSWDFTSDENDSDKELKTNADESYEKVEDDGPYSKCSMTVEWQDDDDDKEKSTVVDSTPTPVAASSTNVSTSTHPPTNSTEMADFSELFSQVANFKQQSQGMPDSQRKMMAEQLAMRLWTSLGCDDGDDDSDIE